MNEYRKIDEPTEKCPKCGVPAPRVFAEPHDSRGRNDCYVCDACKLFWPTEWADAYKFKVKHG